MFSTTVTINLALRCCALDPSGLRAGRPSEARPGGITSLAAICRKKFAGPLT
jgi:hypothetical protein